MLILRFNQKLFSGFDDYYRKNRNQIQENNYNDLVNGSQDDNVKKRAKNLYKDNREEFNRIATEWTKKYATEEESNKIYD